MQKAAVGNTAKQKYILQPAKPNYEGKVSLLLSHNTASAAEIFTLAAKNYRNITSMGLQNCWYILRNTMEGAYT